MSLILVVVGGGIFIVPSFLGYYNQSQQQLKDIVARTKEAIQPNKVDSFDLNQLGVGSKSPSLVLLENMYPSSKLSEDILFFESSNCALSRQNLRANPSKIETWIDFKCKSQKLPHNFFNIEPLNHPLGGSWVNYAYNSEDIFKNEQWLKENKNGLHVLEMNTHFPQEAAWLKWVDTTSYYMILMQTSAFLKEDWVILAVPDAPWVYNVYPKNWESHIPNTFVKVESWNPNQCDYAEGLVCWNRDHRKIFLEKLKLTLLAMVILLLAGLIIYHLQQNQKRLKAQMEKDKQLLVQTLAHELRHPVTGLKISLESFREQYDRLDDNLKGEFLRMTAQLQRLQRLIYASQQYLHSGEEGGPFKFNINELPSVNHFLQDTLEIYKEKINLELLDKDTNFSTDHYWLSMIITNLVKNALIHGAKPVTVKVSHVDDELLIHVSDSGAGLKGNISKYLSGEPSASTNRGMGLGLSLIVRIIRLMGGRLEYSDKPQPTFTVRIKRDA